MPFIKKSRLQDLHDKIAELQNWKDVGVIVEESNKLHIRSMERDLSQLYGFIGYMSKEVPNYETYVLDYMEKEENDELQSDH